MRAAKCWPLVVRAQVLASACPCLYRACSVCVSRVSGSWWACVSGPSAVADNTLTIKQKSTLPISKTRQDKSLFCSLLSTYPPPPAPAATSPRNHQPRSHRPPSFPSHLCCCHRRSCGLGAKMCLAYATRPFSVPNCTARPSRTTEGLILYDASGIAATEPPLTHR